MKNKTTVRKNGQLFGKMDILKCFFEEPEREFHLRELARSANLAPSTISEHLSELVKIGIITSKTDKGFKLFRSNAEIALYKDTKLSYNMYQIRNSGLIDYLIDEFNYPKTIILFGSFRKSENIPGSDIDIFIESAIKKQLDMSRFEKKLKHSIQLFQRSKKDIEKMKSKNKELLNNIINGIVLEGFFEVF
jgi:predicted nucleotidyltransferase/predicted transcriptional regulator|tara:strand:- start:21 stop:593 length:573 start_codon:yes stop_codon:yes gene_type:complete